MVQRTMGKFENNVILWLWYLKENKRIRNDEYALDVRCIRLLMHCGYWFLTGCSTSSRGIKCITKPQWFLVKLWTFIQMSSIQKWHISIIITCMNWKWFRFHLDFMQIFDRKGSQLVTKIFSSWLLFNCNVSKNFVVHCHFFRSLYLLIPTDHICCFTL